jgi:hypothetical protein
MVAAAPSARTVRRVPWPATSAMGDPPCRPRVPCRLKRNTSHDTVSRGCRPTRPLCGSRAGMPSEAPCANHSADLLDGVDVGSGCPRPAHGRRRRHTHDAASEEPRDAVSGGVSAADDGAGSSTVTKAADILHGDVPLPCQPRPGGSCLLVSRMGLGRTIVYRPPRILRLRTLYVYGVCGCTVVDTISSCPRVSLSGDESEGCAGVQRDGAPTKGSPNRAEARSWPSKGRHEQEPSRPTSGRPPGPLPACCGGTISSKRASSETAAAAKSPP